MQNGFKLSGEKDTASLSPQFQRARWWLTGIYVIILAVILCLSGGVTHSAFSQRLERRINRFVPPPSQILMRQPDIHVAPQELRTDLIWSLFFVNSVLLVLAGFWSYWLAGRTLRPIQKMYDEQRRFLSDASHELRTPLAILRIDLENELMDAKTKKEQRIRTESHLEEVARMGTLVENLLVLSRSDESIDLDEYREIISVPDVVCDVIERLQSFAFSYTVSLQMQSSKELSVFVVADRELLFQAVSNIVKNAIMYNKKQGSIFVTIEQRDHQVEIKVVDTGVGIAKEDLKKIFSRFYRVEKSRSRQTGGSGLGLSIVQSIVERFGGSIHVESVFGKGTTVTLLFPIHKTS